MRPSTSDTKSFFIDIAEDFAAGTTRISAVTGFLNLTVILSLWQEKLGIPTITLFGSSFVLYAVIVWLIGHFDRKVIQERLQKLNEGDGR